MGHWGISQQKLLVVQKDLVHFNNFFRVVEEMIKSVATQEWVLFTWGANEKPDISLVGDTLPLLLLESFKPILHMLIYF